MLPDPKFVMKYCIKHIILEIVLICLIAFFGLTLLARNNYFARCAVSAILQFSVVTWVEENSYDNIAHYPDGYHGGFSVSYLAFNVFGFVGHFDRFGNFAPWKPDVIGKYSCKVDQNAKAAVDSWIRESVFFCWFGVIVCTLGMVYFARELFKLRMVHLAVHANFTRQP